MEERRYDGRILRAISGFYWVKTDSGVIRCKPRGIFRKDKIFPVVGDLVKCSVDGSYGTIFEIMKFKSGVQPWDKSALGLRHIAFSVSKEDFDFEVNKIKQMKLKIEADVCEAPSGVKTFFFRDPEGNLLHYIYRPVSL